MSLQEKLPCELNNDRWKQSQDTEQWLALPEAPRNFSYVNLLSLSSIYVDLSYILWLMYGLDLY